MVAANRRFGPISAVYWLLTAYMVAALVWWFIELLHLNEQLHAYRTASAGATDGAAELERRRNILQYLGEGSMFLLLTLVGATFVHRAARKRIRLDAQQRNFMMAVTHELKTPIAVIRLNLETLRRHALDDTARVGLLADNLREADRLEDLCNKILLSTRYDANAVVMANETLDLSALARETLGECRARHADRPFHADISDGILVTGDRLLLKLAMNNLLENAVRYSPANTPVHLSLRDDGHTSRLGVSDEGAGIPDHEKPQLFHKFHRIGREDTRRAKGTGLGLYLTRRIAADHGGSVKVEDNRPTGSTFILELPRTRP